MGYFLGQNVPLPPRSLQFIWIFCVSVPGCLVTKTLFFKACHMECPPFNYFCLTKGLLFLLSLELAILKAFSLFYCTEGPPSLKDLFLHL